MPIAEVALTGVLIECCVGTELWALRARTGVDGVLRDVLPLSLGFVACIWHLNVFFFSDTDGSSCQPRIWFPAPSLNLG